jgi:hypothetical protein
MRTEPKTLPYAPVSETCSELASLALAINETATTAISQDRAPFEMVMIRAVAMRIGLLADHLTGGDLHGDANTWMELQDMAPAESEDIGQRSGALQTIGRMLNLHMTDDASRLTDDEAAGLALAVEALGGKVPNGKSDPIQEASHGAA